MRATVVGYTGGKVRAVGGAAAAARATAAQTRKTGATAAAATAGPDAENRNGRGNNNNSATATAATAATAAATTATRYVPRVRPSYRTVCAGDGNVEAIAVEYDPAVLSYADLLAKFASLHDLTKQKKRQYCSAIFAVSEAQMAAARALVDAHEHFVTSIEELKCWTDAEQRHQKYYAKRDEKRKFLQRQKERAGRR